MKRLLLASREDVKGIGFFRRPTPIHYVKGIERGALVHSRAKQSNFVLLS